MFFFDVHTHKESFSENVFSIENKYPNSTDFTTPFSIGIHPWFIQTENVTKELLIIEEKLQDENCFALGECGLDKVTATDFELQKIVFRKQVQLSEKHKKPLIIHCVKAFQEIIEFKKELKPHQIWILHGFHKNLQVAESLLKNGIVVSFGAAIIHHKKLQEVVSKISTSSILLETDNTSIDIKEVYQKIAALKEITVEDLQQKIKQNFVSLFPRVQSRGFFNFE